MNLPGAICPMTKDGRHATRIWQEGDKSGYACRACHKTWRFDGKGLKETYP